MGRGRLRPRRPSCPDLQLPAMTRVLPHVERDNAPHLVNFATHNRHVLPAAARSVVLDSCRHDHGRTMHLHIVVVMPDHVHLILTPSIVWERRRVYPLSIILWAIKSASAHRINRLLHSSGSVWQTEYFDTVIRRSDMLDEKMDYIRQNPVRAGLISRVEDYEWIWESPRPRAAAPSQVATK